MKYLVAAFTGLGNLIQQTPFLRGIQRLDESAGIHLIGDNRAGALDVAKGLSFITGIRKVPVRASLLDKLRVLSWMNRQRFDATFLPVISSPLWLRPIAYLSNTERVFQHIHVTRMPRVDWLQLVCRPRKVGFVPVLQGRHEIDLYYDLLEAFHQKPITRDYRPELRHEDDASQVREKYGLPARYVCLQLGAAHGLPTAKKWPSEHFSTLICLIKERFPSMGIVLVGSKSEFEGSIEPVVRRHPDLINTTTRTSIDDLCGIIAGATLVVCHDSGVMHVANALGRPVIALYGPTDYTRTAPLGENSVVMRRDIPCSPCMYGFQVSEREAAENCPRTPKHECMLLMHPEEVMGRICEVLPSEAPRVRGLSL